MSRAHITAMVDALKVKGVNAEYLDSVAFDLMAHLTKAEREGAIYADFGKMPVAAIAEKHGIGRRTAYDIIARRRTLCGKLRDSRTLN